MEGPSVHHLAEKLMFFEGQRINFADGNANQPIKRLEKKTIHQIRAVKKRLFFDLENVHAVIHFLMFGSYRVNKTREGMEPRLVIDCSDDVFLTYNSVVKILEDGEQQLEYYDRPREDVLSDRFNTQQAHDALKQYDGPLVDVLLDQDVFGGVGNIIKNEVLFRTHHFPELAASSLTQQERTELIDETISFTRHWLESKRNDEPLGMKIYRKSTCPHCGDRVKKQELGEHDRVTYWCATCQCI